MVNRLLPALVMSALVCAFAEGLTGLDIAQKAHDADQGKTMKSTVEMQLIDKRGNKRVRKIVSLRKDYGKTEKTIMTFLKPADVAGTGFLNWTYSQAGKDDDQWLYLPSLGKVRRISASAKGDYFMGTEFTYDDMGDRAPEEDTHTLDGTEAVGEKECHKITSVPKDKDYMYGKKVAWIDKESFLLMKAEFYDEDGELLKVLTNKGIKKIDDIWTVSGMEMKNIQKNRSTVLTFENIRHNIPVKDAMFTQRMLKKGIRE